MRIGVAAPAALQTAAASVAEKAAARMRSDL
jgi:hypothetical protein